MHDTKTLKASSLESLNQKLAEAKKSGFIPLSAVTSKGGWHEILVIQVPQISDVTVFKMMKALVNLTGDITK